MIVTLTSYEVLLAANVGVRRRVASMHKKSTDANVSRESIGLSLWHTDIESACAELAFAKAFGIYWDGSVNTGKAPDVAGFQIRHTYRENGCLIVRERDADAEVFVLVTGIHPTYTIRGYKYGREAKQDCYLRNPANGNPAWFVPQSDLVSVSEPKKRTSLSLDELRKQSTEEWLKDFERG